MQFDDDEVVAFLLTSEIIPLCLRAIDMGSELSKTVFTSLPNYYSKHNNLLCLFLCWLLNWHAPFLYHSPYILFAIWEIKLFQWLGPCCNLFYFSSWQISFTMRYLSGVASFLVCFGCKTPFHSSILVVIVSWNINYPNIYPVRNLTRSFGSIASASWTETSYTCRWPLLLFKRLCLMTQGLRMYVLLLKVSVL